MLINIKLHQIIFVSEKYEKFVTVTSLSTGYMTLGNASFLRKDCNQPLSADLIRNNTDFGLISEHKFTVMTLTPDPPNILLCKVSVTNCYKPILTNAKYGSSNSLV